MKKSLKILRIEYIKPATFGFRRKIGKLKDEEIN